MSPLPTGSIAALLASLLWSGCATDRSSPRALPSPAIRGSAQAALTASTDGGVILSWVEPSGDGSHSLRFAERTERGWSDPVTISGGTGWFVNWADFPSVLVLPDGGMAAHWLERSGTGAYAYDVRISRSADGGRSWSEPFTPHTDNTASEHGFVSMFPAPGGGLGVVWLDGREMAAAGGEHGHGDGAMTLRYASFDGSGGALEEALLDPMVCECCQTSAAAASSGPVVVYRDRLDGEIRDISVVRRAEGKWTDPRPVAVDNWRINACPVNGPAAAARDDMVVVAWYTGAGERGAVKAAFSADGGASFDPPLIVDDADPAGRVDVLALDDGSALVSWIAGDESGGELRVRRIARNGDSAGSVAVAIPGAARSAGFPRMARSGGVVTVAWNDDGIRTAELDLP